MKKSTNIVHFLLKNMKCSVGKNLPGVPSRDLNSGLPYSRPAHYQLSCAAPLSYADTLKLRYAVLWSKVADPVLTGKTDFRICYIAVKNILIDILYLDMARSRDFWRLLLILWHTRRFRSTRESIGKYSPYSKKIEKSRIFLFTNRTLECSEIKIDSKQ